MKFQIKARTILGSCQFSVEIELAEDVTEDELYDALNDTANIATYEMCGQPCEEFEYEVLK